VFLIAGGLFALTAKTYAEGAAMFPEAGGSSSFARHAFNELVSFVAGWALCLDYILTIAISAFFVPHYLGAFFPALKHGPGDVIGGIIVIAILAGLNIRGLGESAKLNFFLAIMDLGTQLLLVVLGVILVFNPSLLIHQVHLGTTPKWSELIFAVSLAMVAYTGIETVSNMAEEARDPGRDVPKAVNLVLIAVLGVYAGITVVALSALPVVHGTTTLGTVYENDPVLGIVAHFGLSPGLFHILRAYVGILAATILFIATNAGIIGVSRLVYSMGLHRQVPDRLRQLHPKFSTPWIGILVFGVIACLTMIPGKATFLGNIYAFGAMLSFTIAHLAVIKLRTKYPDVERPYTGPGKLRIRGRELPLFAVLGGLGTAIAWVTVTALHVDVAAVGLSWLAIGIFVYIVYRRRQGLDLTSTVKVAIPRPVIDTEAEYESVLVAFDGSGFDPDVLSTAERLAARRARGIHVIVTITVPYSSPIGAAPGPRDRDAAAGAQRRVTVRQDARDGPHRAAVPRDHRDPQSPPARDRAELSRCRRAPAAP